MHLFHCKWKFNFTFKRRASLCVSRGWRCCEAIIVSGDASSWTTAPLIYSINVDKHTDTGRICRNLAKMVNIVTLECDGEELDDMGVGAEKLSTSAPSYHLNLLFIQAIKLHNYWITGTFRVLTYNPYRLHKAVWHKHLRRNQSIIWLPGCQWSHLEMGKLGRTDPTNFQMRRTNTYQIATQISKLHY